MSVHNLLPLKKKNKSLKLVKGAVFVMFSSEKFGNLNKTSVYSARLWQLPRLKLAVKSLQPYSCKKALINTSRQDFVFVSHLKESTSSSKHCPSPNTLLGHWYRNDLGVGVRRPGLSLTATDMMCDLGQVT